MSKNGAQNDVAVIIRQSVAWQAIVLGVNGIALSLDAEMLYQAVTSGTHAYAVPTDLLRNPRIGKAALASAVRDLGKVGGNTDGLEAQLRWDIVPDIRLRSWYRLYSRNQKRRLHHLEQGPSHCWRD